MAVGPSSGSPAPSGSTAIPRGTHAGKMQGHVLEEQREFQLWGLRFLFAAIAISVVLALVTNADTVGSAFLYLLKAAIFVVLAWFVIQALFLHGEMGVGIGIFRGIGALARALVGLVRGAGGSASTLNRSGKVYMLTLRRFRIVDIVGNSTSCVLVGEIYGDVMRQGDLVCVHGRMAREGHVKATQVDILDKVNLPARSVVKPRFPPGYRGARLADRVYKVAAVLILFQALSNVVALLGS